MIYVDLVLTAYLHCEESGPCLDILTYSALKKKLIAAATNPNVCLLKVKKSYCVPEFEKKRPINVICS